MGRAHLIWVAAGLTALGVGGVWLMSKRSSDGGRARQVLLISIDTLRRDHVGCYGDALGATPNLDAFAARAVVFDHAYSHAPMTLPSHASMLTGLTPLRTGVHDNFEHRLAPERTTIAEWLADRGFVTGAVVSSFVLDSQFGLDQGFDHYDDQFQSARTDDGASERLADEATDRAIEWLTAHKGDDFFFLLHYYDPHARYAPPPSFAKRFVDAPYRGEIAFVDDAIGQVLTALNQAGMFNEMTVIITADHGEMLGEHGEQTHDFFIYQSALRIPLMIKPPGSVSAVRRGEVTGLIDVFPTVCGLVGVDPPAGIDGVDLAPLSDDQPPVETDRTLYCECVTPKMYNAAPLRGLVSKRWKYIESPRAELYDVTADPAESINLADVEVEMAQQMSEQLRRLADESASQVSNASPVALGSDATQKLQSLGYVGGAGGDDSGKSPTTLDDPKDLIAFHQQNRTVIHRILAGDYEAAEAQCRAMLEQRPDFFGGYLHLAEIAAKQGDFASTEAVLRDAIKVRPDSAKAHDSLGFALVMQRRVGDAIPFFQRAIALKPDLATARENLGIALRRVGRLSESAAQLQEAVALRPEHAASVYNLGVTLMQQRRLDEAVDLFDRAVELDGDYVSALNGLSKLLVVHPDPGIRDASRALRLAKRAAELSDRMDPGILETLAAAYAANGQPDQALATAQEALELATKAGAEKLAATLHQRIVSYKGQSSTGSD